MKRESKHHVPNKVCKVNEKLEKFMNPPKPEWTITPPVTIETLNEMFKRLENEVRK